MINSTPQQLRNYISKNVQIKNKFANKIIMAYPNLRIEYLMYGEKPIFIEPTEVVNSNELVKETNTSYVVEENKLLKQQLELAQKRIKMLEDREEVGGNQGSVDNLSADHKITGKKRNRSK